MTPIEWLMNKQADYPTYNGPAFGFEPDDFKGFKSPYAASAAATRLYANNAKALANYQPPTSAALTTFTRSQAMTPTTPGLVAPPINKIRQTQIGTMPAAPTPSSATMQQKMVRDVGRFAEDPTMRKRFGKDFFPQQAAKMQAQMPRFAPPTNRIPLKAGLAGLAILGGLGGLGALA